MGKIKININNIKVKSNILENKIINNTVNNATNVIVKDKHNIEPPPIASLKEQEKSIRVKESSIKKKIGISSIKKKINISSIKKKDIEEELHENTNLIDKSKNIETILKEKKTIGNIKSKKVNGENKQIIDNKKDEKNKPIFTNYESVFEKDKVPILDHIKKLKGLPKTNILLLTILTSVTIAGIGFLFYSNPKIHNLNNYKTSIMDTYKAVTSTGKTSSNIDKPPIIKQINKGGYIYNVEIKKLLGKNIYIYKGKYFDNKDKFDKFINKEIENRKKIKVTTILKNSFSK